MSRPTPLPTVTPDASPNRHTRTHDSSKYSMPVDLPAASMIDSKRALQFTAVTGVFYASFFISELPTYATPMKKFYALEPTAVTDFFNNAFGVMLMWACMQAFYVAAKGSAGLKNRFVVANIIAAFSRATVLACHGSKDRAGGGMVASEHKLGSFIAVLTMFLLAEAVRVDSNLVPLRHWIKDSKSLKQKIITIALLMEFYYMIILHFGDVTVWFSPKVKATDYLAVHWTATIGFMKWLQTMIMFTAASNSDVQTVAKFDALSTLTMLYVMRKHQAVFKAAEFSKHFTMTVARLGITLFAAF